MNVTQRYVSRKSKCLLNTKNDTIPSKSPDPTRDFWRTLSLQDILQRLEEGILQSPAASELVYIVQKCRKYRDRSSALRLHSYLRKNVLESDPYLGNYLVPMLVECDSLGIAQQIFDRLEVPNEWSWDSLISGYNKYGNPEQALLLYRKMQSEFCLPIAHTFVVLLKACVKLNDISTGMGIHAEVARNGLLDRDRFLGSALVDMYAKCGSPSKARDTFKKVQVQDVVLWTTLIASYVEHGEDEEALRCYELMQTNDVSPDPAAFVCTLKACQNVGAMYEIYEIHAEIERHGLLKANIILGNALIDAYAKLGILRKAYEVFDELSERDIITWTSIISGYTEFAHGEEAIKYFRRMQLDGVPANAVTYVCILNACSEIGMIELGHEIHMKIECHGFLEREAAVGSALVDMYVKCESLPTAHEVFDKLPVHNAASWTALVGGYVEYGLPEEALSCFHVMQFEGVPSDTVLLAYVLKACSMTGNIDTGQKIHEDIEQQELLHSDKAIGNSLLDMYVKCGSFVKAHEVFEKLVVQDVVSWTVLITGYTEHGQPEEALKLFEQMQNKGIFPNGVTLISVLKACAMIGALDKGQEIHGDIERYGIFESNVNIANGLVDMYAKCGVLPMAKQVFDQLTVRTVISWGALIAGYAENDQSEEAINYFDQMQLQGFIPDAVIYIYTLKACGCIGAKDKGQEIHSEIERRGLILFGLVGNALIDMYAKCGCLEIAEQFFDSLPIQDVVSWTTIITGYAEVGDCRKVCIMFERMLRQGIRPDPVTFLILLNSCSTTGQFEISQTFFDAMTKEYGIVPGLQHHLCMIGLLVKSGDSSKVVQMVDRKQFFSNTVTWNTLLGACKSWGNMQLAEKVFQQSLPS